MSRDQFVLKIKVALLKKNVYECFKKNGLHIIHFNSRSLLSKLAAVRTLVVDFNAAIVCVTETWFDDSVMDSEIKLFGYVVQIRRRCVYVYQELVGLQPTSRAVISSIRDFVDQNYFTNKKNRFSMCVL